MLFRRRRGPANYRRLLVAVSTANLADGMYLAAGPVLAATLTRDPLLVAGVTVVQRASVLLSVPVAGLVADRMDRGRMLRMGNGWRAGIFGALALAVALGTGPTGALIALYAAAACLGVAEAVADTAAMVLPPHVVDADRLGAANGQVQAWTSVGQELIGPSVGGTLFVLASWSPFAAMSLAFALAAAAAGALVGDLRAPGTAAERRTARGALRDLRDGWAWFWGNPVLRVAAVAAAVANALATGVMAVLVLIVTVDLGYPSGVYGLLLVTLAVGALAAGLLAGPLSRTLSPATAVASGAGVTAGGFTVLAVSTSAVHVGVALALVSFGVTLSNVTVFTLRQTLVPPEFLGRVTASYRMLALAGMPVGAGLGGLLARTDHTTPVWLAAGGFAVIGTALSSAMSGARWTADGSVPAVQRRVSFMHVPVPAVVPPLPEQPGARSLPAARPLGFGSWDALGRRASWPAL